MTRSEINHPKGPVISKLVIQGSRFKIQKTLLIPDGKCFWLDLFFSNIINSNSYGQFNYKVSLMVTVLT